MRKLLAIIGVLLMALSVKVGTFLADSSKTATQTIAVTDVGFQPQAIVFWWFGQTSATDAIGNITTRNGFGFATSSSARNCAIGISVHGGATSATARTPINTSCIATVSGAGSIDGQLDFQSFDAGGFTLIVDDQLPASFYVSYMAFGGDSITNVATGITAGSGSTGDQDFTTPGFQPDMVFLAAASEQAVNTPSTDCSVNFGMASGASNMASVGWASDGGQDTMDTQGWGSDSQALVVMDDDTSGTPVDCLATLSSFLSTGFRLNWSRVDAASQVNWLVIQGGDWLVGNSATRTDGNDIALSGLGAAPSGLLVISAMQSENSGATSTAHARVSIGAATSASERVAQSMLDENATANAEVTTCIEYDAVYASITTGSAIDGLMDVKSFDADGVTFVMDDADSSAFWFGYLLCGPAEAVGASTHTTRSHPHGIGRAMGWRIGGNTR